MREGLRSNWILRGRSVPGQSAASLRLRAYRQKMAMRAQRAAAMHAANHSISGFHNLDHGADSAMASSWVSMGPAPMSSDASGNGMQDYNWVSGRATAVVIDPADASGNTVLLGGAYGGVWKSSNAGNLNSDPSSVTWKAMIDEEPTLAVGAIAMQPGNSNVILVGTGETNNSGDSYYGLGILRSTDGGATWTQIQSAATRQSFLGIGFSKIVFSSANPNLAVASTAGDNGLYSGEEQDGNSTARGLYYSLDAGATWSRAVLSDSAIPASATAVTYNASQGASGTFYAFIRRHGLYSSTDGQHFTRMPVQPSAALSAANCPPGANASSCLIYRGEFAVVQGRNEMYVWMVDVQPDQDGDPAPVDQGIWRSTNGGGSWTAIPHNGITNCGDSAFGPNSGCGVEQGWYNLEIAAVPNAGATDLYAGAVNLYKCTIASGTSCTQGDWINLTHVYGCSPLAAPAHLHPDQHGISFMVANGKAVGYFAHDGGISRTLDGYSDLTTGSCSGTNQFDSLSQGLGSMMEFVAFSAHPTNADILLGGTQDNGSPKTNRASSSSTWQNALGGDGGFNAINPSIPNEWFAANPYLSILKCEFGTDCNDSGFIEVVNPAVLGGDEGGFYTPYILDQQNTNELLVGTCRVWRVSTSGTAPLQLSNDFDTLGTGACTGSEVNMVTALAAGGPAVNNYSSVVYAVTNGYGPMSGSPGGEVWVTTNAGVALMSNVSQNVNPNGYAISSVAIDGTDITGKTAYIGIMGFSTPLYPTSHVWKTVNAGASWIDWTGMGLPDAPVNALLVDAQAAQVYAGTDAGVFVSSTSAPSWIEVGPAPESGNAGYLPNAPVSALQMFNPDANTKTLLASTYGRGMWSYPLITSAAYSNSISDSTQTVFSGQTATFHGMLTSQNGYTSTVSLSCSGITPATCTMQPGALTPTGSYALTAGGAVGDYFFNSHAVGSDPKVITRDADVTLHVVDFNLTAPSPNSVNVAQGATSSASTFQVTAAGSFAQAVALSCSTGLPTGASCAFSPSASVNPTSSTPVMVSMTITAGSGTPVGGPTTVTVAAMAEGAPLAKTQTISLTVTGPTPDFAIAVTAIPNSTVAGQNVIWNGTLTALNGYSKSVALSCGAGAPATCGVSPAMVTPKPAGAAFTVTTGNATTGTFHFTIQGTDGGVTHATPAETLAVGTDVAWTDTGSNTATVAAGQNAIYTFSAAPVGGSSFTSAVTFSCSNTVLKCQFNPASIAAGAGSTGVTLTIATDGPNGALPGKILRSGGTWLHGSGGGDVRGRALPFLAFACMGLAGVVGFGRRVERSSGMSTRILFVCLGMGLLETSCGGGGLSGGGDPPPTPGISVTVGAGVPSSLYPNCPGWPNQTAQFTATVKGAANSGVNWAVTTPNGGSIDANGLYTAPAVAGGLPASVVISATSQADTSKSGTARETLESATLPGTYSNILITATEATGVHSNAVTLIVR